MTTNPESTALNDAILYAQQLLESFLLQPNFDATLTEIFGEGAANFNLDLLKNSPQVIITNELPLNTRGAYAAQTNTIYLSQSLIASSNINESPQFI
jgi:hypothetical protein